MKKVIIVGAGIAGMSAGIYALQSGFDVTILEQHTVPGGNCTSWRRKGYLFEGGLHWLTGSDQRQPLHRLWREVGALTGDSRIKYGDPFLTCEYKGEFISLYRDPEKFQEHLCSVSPEDTDVILRLCKDIKTFSALQMPVTNIRGLFHLRRRRLSGGRLPQNGDEYGEPLYGIGRRDQVRHTGEKSPDQKG